VGFVLILAVPLTSLFTVNMTPYGEIRLNLDRRLNLATGGVPGT
jgi:hypothetical protein